MSDTSVGRTLAATLAALACGVAGCGSSSSSSSAKPAGSSTQAATTPKGAFFAGQACSPAHQPVYRASGLNCIDGHLQKAGAAKSGVSTSPSGGSSGGAPVGGGTTTGGTTTGGSSRTGSGGAPLSGY